MTCEYIYTIKFDNVRKLSVADLTKLHETDPDKVNDLFYVEKPGDMPVRVSTTLHWILRQHPTKPIIIMQEISRAGTVKGVL